MYVMDSDYVHIPMCSCLKSFNLKCITYMYVLCAFIVSYILVTVESDMTIAISKHINSSQSKAVKIM